MPDSSTDATRRLASRLDDLEERQEEQEANVCFVNNRIDDLETGKQRTARTILDLHGTDTYKLTQRINRIRVVLVIALGYIAIDLAFTIASVVRWWLT